jgi:hypothetical protein
VHTDASGPALFVAGNFTTAAVPPPTAWPLERLGVVELGAAGQRHQLPRMAMATYDDGTGPPLRRRPVSPPPEV